MIDPRGPAGLSVDLGPVSGYAWPQSVESGQAFALHGSSSSGAPVRVEIDRVGATRTRVWQSDDVAFGDNPYPENVTAQGCLWPESVSVSTQGWPTGYYEIRFTYLQTGDYSLAFVIVRPRSKERRRILLQLSTNTWAAYNDVHSGRNLYTGDTTVSFNRPMAPGFLEKPRDIGWRVAAQHAPDRYRTVHRGYKAVHHFSDWCGSAGWASWEYPFVEWAEGHGYEFDYASNADLEIPGLVDSYDLVLSIGHDEYWSKGMRDAVEKRVSDGGNVAFLSGNTAFWQVRLEGDGASLVCYKEQFESDPLYGTARQNEVATMWSDPLSGRPENQMTGVSFTRGGYHRIGSNVANGAGGYTVQRPDHWLLSGTGAVFGDVIGAESKVVGYECDGCELTLVNGLPYPTGRDGTPVEFEVVATAPAALFSRESSARPIPDDKLSELEYSALRILGSSDAEACAQLAHGQAILGASTCGGTVVTSGCTDWINGLDGRSPVIETITHTILKRLSSHEAR